jgi:hypothetical protein
VTKEELIEAIWPDVIVSDQVLTRCVSEVRQAIIALAGSFRTRASSVILRSAQGNLIFRRPPPVLSVAKTSKETT